MFYHSNKMLRLGFVGYLLATMLVFALICFYYVPCVLSEKDISTLYEEVCSNEPDVELTTLEQIRNLYKEQVRHRDLPEYEDPIYCPEKTQDALEVLHDLINIEKDKICTLKKATFMKNFHLDFVVNKAKEIPTSIKKFFAIYGNRVSQACRKSMIQRLAEIQPRLSELDVSIMNEWSDDSSPLTYILPDPNDYEDLILPKTLARILKVRRNKMILRLSTGYEIRRYQYICQRRFRPIYGALVMPLLTMKKVGFNFKDLHAEPRNTELNKLIYKWYRVVFMCEALNGFEIKVDPEANPNHHVAQMQLNPFKSGKTPDLNEISHADDFLSTKEIQEIDYNKDLDLRRNRVDVVIHDPLVLGHDESMEVALKRYFDQTKTGFSYLLSWLSKLTQTLKRGLEKLTRKNLPIDDANKLIKLIDDQRSRIVPPDGNQANQSIESFKQETLAGKISEIWDSFRGNIGKNAVTVILTAIVLSIFSGVGYVVSRGIECDRAAESAMAALDGGVYQSQNSLGPCD